MWWATCRPWCPQGRPLYWVLTAPHLEARATEAPGWGGCGVGPGRRDVRPQSHARSSRQHFGQRARQDVKLGLQIHFADRGGCIRFRQVTNLYLSALQRCTHREVRILFTDSCTTAVNTPNLQSKTWEHLGLDPSKVLLKGVNFP